MNFNDLIPDLQKLWLADPLEATKKCIDIQLAAAEAFSEALEQSADLNRLAAKRWSEITEQLGQE